MWILNRKMSKSDNITVAVKVRPLIKREREQKLTEQWRIQNETIECIHPMFIASKFSFGEFLVCPTSWKHAQFLYSDCRSHLRWENFDADAVWESWQANRSVGSQRLQRHNIRVWSDIVWKDAHNAGKFEWAGAHSAGDSKIVWGHQRELKPLLSPPVRGHRKYMLIALIIMC